MAQKKESFIKTKIIFLFFTSFFSMIFFSNIKFIYFAPLLIFLFYNISFASILWIACLVGFIQDLFSEAFFGINAILYLLSSIILYRGKKYFNDKPINLSIFTWIFSIIFSVLSPILFFIFDKKINLSITWLITDVILYPAIDGIYAFLFFAMPILFFEYLKKTGYKNLWIGLKTKIFRRSQKAQ
ncbi:MAG: hypothetical protein K1060chlam1_01294 [Candidatus Anoxychlamydiales bacterium]|nr:hypothetical protein [Candidatus Anoxychlamydiales bacterium]